MIPVDCSVDDHSEGIVVDVVAVVAVWRRAEQPSAPSVNVRGHQSWQPPHLAGDDWIAHEEIQLYGLSRDHIQIVEEDAAMESVNGAPPRSNDGVRQAAEGSRRRHEAGGGLKSNVGERAGRVAEYAEEAEHGRRPVKLAESSAEAGAGDEAAP